MAATKGQRESKFSSALFGPGKKRFQFHNAEHVVPGFEELISLSDYLVASEGFPSVLSESAKPTAPPVFPPHESDCRCESFWLISPISSLTSSGQSIGNNTANLVYAAMPFL
jgi:hypothetical protein